MTLQKHFIDSDRMIKEIAAFGKKLAVLNFQPASRARLVHVLNSWNVESRLRELANTHVLQLSHIRGQEMKITWWLKVFKCTHYTLIRNFATQVCCLLLYKSLLCILDAIHYIVQWSLPAYVQIHCMIRTTWAEDNPLTYSQRHCVTTHRMKKTFVA